MKLIVGIDPGLTAALAFLDAEGDHYRTVSRRNFSFSEICEAVAEEGDPIVIAADTQHTPQLLRKIAATFGCRLHAPRKDMMVGEKKSLTENMLFGNDHERDALAAALHARQEFAPLFEKIDYYLEGRDIKSLSADVKELIVKGEAANIEQAVKMLTTERSTGCASCRSERKETKVVSKIIESKKVLELRQKIQQLEKGKSILESYVRHLEEEIVTLRRQLMKPKSKERSTRALEDAVSRMRKENQRLMKEIEDYKALAGKGVEIVYPYREGEDFSGKTVLVKGDFSRKALEKQQPRAIISDSAFLSDVPVVPANKVNIQAAGNVLVVDRHELEKALQESFLVWLRHYKEKRANY